MTRQIIIASALLALASPAFAQAPAAPPANVTRAQVTAELNAAFGRVDTNKDGSITLAEANAAQARVGAEANAQISKNAEAEFAKLDKDKNGQLSLAEFKAVVRPATMTPGSQIMQALDTNKDGKISSAEFQAQRLGQFDQLDTNHDGTVTQTELQAARAR